jgi:putative transposase
MEFSSKLMILNYQYRFYPEKKQKETLNQWLRVCQYWYNWQLGDRFTWWEENREYLFLPSGEFTELTCSLKPSQLREKPEYFTQKRLLPSFKEDLRLVRHSGELLDFSMVHSQTLQDVSKRVALAFQRFIQGDQNGKRSGKPRFKSRYRTFKLEANGVKIAKIEKKWLFLKFSKVDGWLKVRLHRPLPFGFKIKNILVTKKADGWYVNICLDDPTVPVFSPDKIEPTWENSIGMDAVLHENDYLALSDGKKLPSLKSFRKNHRKLKKISQKKNARRKGSKARRKLARKEGKQHQKIARARKDHAFNTAIKLVKTGKKVFFIEKLNLKNLSKRNKKKQDENGKYLQNGQSAKSGLNKSWNDAAFGNFFDILDYIAAKAGAIVKEVKPAYTSQVLSYRNEIIFTDCSIREYFDPIEQFLVDRDINAAINIKQVGLGLFPTIKRRKGKITFSDKKRDESTLKEVRAVFSQNTRSLRHKSTILA